MTTTTDRRNAIRQAFLAAIVESSDDAIVSKDLSGIVGTWNKGAERLFGYAAEEMVGRPITVLIPQALQAEEIIILDRVQRGERIDHYETVRRRKDGTEVDISLTVSPIRNAEGQVVAASKIARDITARKRADALLRKQTERFETLGLVARTISSDLDLQGIVQRVTDSATQLAGAKFGAFFYNVTHRGGQSYLLYTLSGAPREAFEKFGLPRATAVFEPTFRGSGVVRSDDIRADPRYGKNAPHRGMPQGHLPVVSYLAVPVISRSGDVIGGLFFGHDEPAVFTQASEDAVSAIAAHAAIAIDNARLYAALQQDATEKELLLKEFKHRIKNMLATVQALARQTLRACPPADREAFLARIRALDGAHDLLALEDWGRASMRGVTERALVPFGRDRFVVEGPDATLNANRALLLTMALHELATNAVKYGALSGQDGKVAVIWETSDHHLTLTWRESGGPPVKAPERKGFGSVLIEQATDGRAQVEYAPDGLSCRLEVALH